VPSYPDGTFEGRDLARGFCCQVSAQTAARLPGTRLYDPEALRRCTSASRTVCVPACRCEDAQPDYEMVWGGMTIWEVMADADRERWTYVPSVDVGPLRFGMSPAEATAAAEDFTARLTSARAGNCLKAEFRRPASPPWFRDAVTAYFGQSGGLFFVAVDAQSGPQVVMDGIELVGRVPSHVKARLLEHVKGRDDIMLRYQWEGDPGVEEWGLMMRAQRVGDVVLTRPVLGERGYTMWDVIPGDELEVR
jgi:hypothetical protein